MSSLFNLLSQSIEINFLKFLTERFDSVLEFEVWKSLPRIWRWPELIVIVDFEFLIFIRPNHIREDSVPAGSDVLLTVSLHNAFI